MLLKKSRRFLQRRNHSGESGVHSAWRAQVRYQVWWKICSSRAAAGLWFFAAAIVRDAGDLKGEVAELFLECNTDRTATCHIPTA
jgi:hypothetical protein